MKLSWILSASLLGLVAGCSTEPAKPQSQPAPTITPPTVVTSTPPTKVTVSTPISSGTNVPLARWSITPFTNSGVVKFDTNTLGKVTVTPAVTVTAPTIAPDAVISNATAMVSTAVYAPDYSHANEPMKDGVLAWNAEQQTVDATNGQDFARFVFTFTNVSNQKFAILNVHPSCGCTTAEMPPTPWLLEPGTNGTIKLKVDLANKNGSLFKTVMVTTEKGAKNLMLRINIAPPPPPRALTAEERAHGVAMSTVDRQAVFKNDCASCHLPSNLNSKFGKNIFDALCVICHEANPRATMVPDLKNLPGTTSEEFWRTWITGGKPGTLMPAFANSQGGPLSDMQVASLAAYLNAVIPPHAPRTTNAPAIK
jgi:cytochrome c553